MNPKTISITIYNKSLIFNIIRVGYRCIVVTDTIGNLQTTRFGALHHFQQISVRVSFIGGGKQRKPQTCHKSLANFIT
jgi:hypothetical protein